MEGEAYPYPIKEVDRRVSEAVTRINVLEAGKQENASRIAVLESQRADIKEDVDRLGDKLRDEIRLLKNEEIKPLRAELQTVRGEITARADEKVKSTLGQRVAYISAAGAVLASLFLAIAQIVGHS